MSEAKRGPPQQLASWQSAYTKRLSPLGFFESSDAGGYAYPSELVRKNEEGSSEDEGGSEPEREDDACGDGDEDEDGDSGEAEEDVVEVTPPPAPQDLER